MISLKNVTKIFKKNRVLDDVTVRFPTGRLSVIVGEHESGKRTLLRLLAGELKPDSGRVIAKRRTSRAFAYKDNDFLEGLKMSDYCTLWSLLYRNFDMQKFRDMLSLAGIADNNKFPNFSEDMQTWFKISLVIASNADVMILDEPMLNLNSGMQQKLISVIEETANNGKTVVVTSQEISEFEKSAGFVAVLHNGTIILAGETEKLLACHKLMPGASTISPDFKVIGPVLNERLVETTDDVGRSATLKEIVSGYIHGSSS